MLSREELSTILRDKGFRITPQREKILDIFLSLPEGEHLSAEDLQNMLRRDSSDISLATSYRTLKLLAGLGVLREVDFAEDQKHYELARDADGMEHHHLVNVDTGEAIEFTSETVFEVAKVVAEKHGFDVLAIQFTIIGRQKDLQGSQN